MQKVLFIVKREILHNTYQSVTEIESTTLASKIAKIKYKIASEVFYQRQRSLRSEKNLKMGIFATRSL